MTVVSLMSPGGSPGVTTCAMATTYGWGGRVVLAECDPNGGNILAGYLGAQLETGDIGLLPLSLALGHNGDPAVLWEHLIALDGEPADWLLLPGLTNPREAAQLNGSWGTLLDAFAKHDLDLVIDLGRIGGTDTPLPLIEASDTAVMVLRPTLRQLASAKPRLATLLKHDVDLALVLIGPGDFTAAEMSDGLFGLPVLAELPHDPAPAALLSDGHPTRKQLNTSRLARSCSDLAKTLCHRRTP